jgi:hypothetical protein
MFQPAAKHSVEEEHFSANPLSRSTFRLGQYYEICAKLAGPNGGRLAVRTI